MLMRWLDLRKVLDVAQLQGPVALSSYTWTWTRRNHSQAKKRA